MSRVLFVDDEPAILNVMGRLLRTYGFSVTTASNASAALAALDPPPLVALVDVMMPDIDGMDLAVEIWKTLPKLPIVFCTGYPSAVVQERASRLGAFALLEKPMLPDELVPVLRAAIATNTAGAEQIA